MHRKDKDNIFSQALFEIKDIENAIAENAKLIMADQLKEEISEIIANKLHEQDEMDVDQTAGVTAAMPDDATDVYNADITGAADMGADMASMEVDMGAEDMGAEDMGAEDMGAEDMGAEEEYKDLTAASDADVIKAYKQLGPDDGIVIQKTDNNDIEFTTPEGDEYLIKDNTVTESKKMRRRKPINEEVIYELHLTDAEYNMLMSENKIGEYQDADDEAKKAKKLVDGDENIPFEEIDEIVPFEENVQNFWENKIGEYQNGGGTAKSAEKMVDDNESAPFEEVDDIVPFSENKRSRRINQKLQRENRMLKKATQNRNKKIQEYDKALKLMRENLNKAAVFNSNLSFATKLFTEHAMTAKEKAKVMSALDCATTLNESKEIYLRLKASLEGTPASGAKKVIDESINKSVRHSGKSQIVETKTFTDNAEIQRQIDMMNFKHKK